ncbi:hypothetical protein LCGC14_1089080 [marine sediment metagenome]|uniref:Uncharacterized protein n=1 Tax=marine sediment metagenome TaxID=412755 RepID=A0A0F9MHF5_9ZZZZ
MTLSDVIAGAKKKLQDLPESDETDQYFSVHIGVLNDVIDSLERVEAKLERIERLLG